jgi:hypothetical protein
MAVKIEKRTIGPVEAKKLLEKNNINRKLTEERILYYYQQMISGEWIEDTGDTIKIGPDGVLFDGQHRLHAVIKYGKPLHFQVATGVDSNSFLVLDTGKVRSAADVASIQGYSHAGTVTAAAKAILLFKSGHYSQDSKRGIQASNTKIMEFLAVTPELTEMCTYVTSIYNRFRVLSKTNMTMLYYLFSERHQEMCDEFFEKYSTGIDLSESSPIRILRDRLMREYQMTKNRMSGRDKLALTIYAWNAFREKKRVQQLTLQKDYKFPKPI